MKFDHFWGGGGDMRIINWDMTRGCFNLIKMSYLLGFKFIFKCLLGSAVQKTSISRHHVQQPNWEGLWNPLDYHRTIALSGSSGLPLCWQKLVSWSGHSWCKFFQSGININDFLSSNFFYFFLVTHSSGPVPGKIMHASPPSVLLQFS